MKQKLWHQDNSPLILHDKYVAEVEYEEDGLLKFKTEEEELKKLAEEDRLSGDQDALRFTAFKLIEKNMKHQNLNLARITILSDKAATSLGRLVIIGYVIAALLAVLILLNF